MALLSKLLVALGLDASDYDAGLNEAKTKAKTGAAAIGQEFSAIGDKLTGAGTKLTAGLTAPIVAMGLKSLDAASDLDESMNKVNVVFGESAAAIQEFAATADTALGQSTQQALEAAGTFGNLFTAMEIGEPAAAEMSMGLVTLASDLASFNNANPAEVLEALRAGLTGETEPLKRFGINLNAATVQAKALEMGLIGVTETGTPEAMTAAAKAQATYALVLKQTTTAQGDFARTSTGMANQTRIAGAQLSNVAATMGQHLLPVGVQLIGMINGVLEKFKSLDPETQKTIVTILAVAAAIGPVLIALGSLASGIGSIIGLAGSVSGALSGVAGVLTGPVGIAIAAVVAAVAVLYLAWKNDWGGIRTWLTEVWETKLLPTLKQVAAWLQENVPKAIGFLKDAWENKLLPALRAVWSFIETYIVPLFQALVDVAIAMLKKEIEALSGLWQNVLWPALQKVWSFIQDNIIPAFKAVAEVVSAVLGPPLQWLKENVLEPLWNSFKKIGDVIGSVIGFLQDLAASISNLQLPDWLTPGSPTPFELGLAGIGRALSELSRAQLPEFQARLRLIPATAPLGVGLAAAGAMGGAGGGSQTIEVHYHVDQMVVSSQDAAEREARNHGYLLVEELRRRGMARR